MPPRQAPKIILGCASWGSPSDPATKFHNATEALPLLKTLLAHGHSIIDTSRRYPATAPGTSEDVLGETLAFLPPDSITIHTKTLSAPGCHKPGALRKSIADSLAALKVESVNTIYLHFPDRSVPLSDPVSTLSEVVNEGKATQWGLSNYTVEDLREILILCEQHNWIKPGAFSDAYNPLNRKSLPIIQLCHEHNIQFNAYSSGASGVLSPSSTRLTANNYIGTATRNLYANPRATSAIDRVRNLAAERGLNGHEIAIRWTMYHGELDGALGDGVVLGVSSVSQLEETLLWVERGPLEEEVAEVLGGLWEDVREQ